MTRTPAERFSPGRSSRRLGPLDSLAPSDHWDGARFHNPRLATEAAVPARGLLQVLRWRLRGERAVWPREVADPVFPPPPGKVAAGTAAVTFVNHATFLLRLPAASPAGIVVLTDPIFSERCSPLSWAGPRRARRPGLAFDDLPRPDLVLLSHNHYDHMDLPSLRALQRRHAPRFVHHARQRRPPRPRRHRGDRTGLVG